MEEETDAKRVILQKNKHLPAAWHQVKEK